MPAIVHYDHKLQNIANAYLRLSNARTSLEMVANNDALKEDLTKGQYLALEGMVSDALTGTGIAFAYLDSILDELKDGR